MAYERVKIELASYTEAPEECIVLAVLEDVFNFQGTQYLTII